MKINIRAWIVVCTATSHILSAQTHLDLRSQIKSADLSSVGATKPAQTGNVLPLTCGVGEVFFLTSASAGTNLMVCASSNQWTSSGSGTGTGGSLATQAAGASVGTATTLNLMPGTYVTQTVTCSGGICSYQPDVDTTKISTNTTIQSGQLMAVTTTSSSPTTFTGVMSLNDPVAAYAANQELIWNVGSTACAGGAMTLNIDGLGAIPLKQADGATNMTLAQCTSNLSVPLIYNATTNTFNGPSAPGGTGSPVTIPVSTTLLPFGNIDESFPFTAVLGSPNNVQYYQVLVPSPGIILNSLKVFYPSGGNTGHTAWAIYNSSCSLVGQSMTFTGAGTQESVAFPFNALSLAAGSYYLAYTADSTSTAFFAASDSGYYGYLWNTGESSSTYRAFLGSNVSTTAGSVLTFPSSCGARTALQVQGTRYFPWVVLQ